MTYEVNVRRPGGQTVLYWSSDCPKAADRLAREAERNEGGDVEIVESGEPPLSYGFPLD
ncbi:hypothetical protein [Kitasatospora xanthocidica]|uniref:hypothetical protein n=1 Tax=Kitasatospora xanthocidica TaxID=83382 RepID=UPI0015F34511|nr:hypothetical protein [Kitasatospora xanthocidica]